MCLGIRRRNDCINTTERQIVSALDKLHRDTIGGKETCRFEYDGRTDIYTCVHHSFSGHDVIGSVNDMNYYPLLEGNDN